jgi:hypothetical protein
MTTTIIAKETAVSPLSRLNFRLIAQTGLLLAVFIGLFAYVQFGTDALAGNDGYYHSKMGWLIRQEGLKPDFPWLPQTILNADAFYDHHLLYHVYLALFATTDPAVDGGAALTQGTKFASILLPSLAFLAIWWLLRGQGVIFASVWASGLMGVSSAFLYRMSMPRAQSASLLVLALALHWLLKGRYRLLLPLGFVYVWLYNAFPLLLVVAGFYVAATWLLERRIVWQALVYPAIGIGLGIAINPYFPENVSFIISHLLPKIGESATKVGNEWYAYDTDVLLRNSGFALGVFVLGILGLGWQNKRMDKATLVMLGTAVFFAFLLFRARRFVEYFPAFALMFAALSMSPIITNWLREKRPSFYRLAPLLMLLILAWSLSQTLRAAREDLADSKPADYYAGAALWLHANSEPGVHIFQTDWDDFTRLFFYNTDAVYTAGLDPTYTELYDAALYEEWVQVAKGNVDRPSEFIKARFGSEFVFTDLNHEGFLETAAEDPGLEEVYRDEYAVIFAVR